MSKHQVTVDSSIEKTKLGFLSSSHLLNGLVNTPPPPTPSLYSHFEVFVKIFNKDISVF